MTQFLVTREVGKYAVVSSPDGRPPYTRHGPLCPDPASANRLFDSTIAIQRVSPLREGDDAGSVRGAELKPKRRRLREAAHPAS